LEIDWDTKDVSHKDVKILYEHEGFFMKMLPVAGLLLITGAKPNIGFLRNQFSKNIFMFLQYLHVFVRNALES